MHKQKFIKVNAPVDEGVADLVTALSAFARLQTISSCQGSQDRPARILFIYGCYEGRHFWRELAEFVLGFFGPALVREVGDRATVYLQVCESGLIQAELTVWHEAFPHVLRALKRLHKRFTSEADHKLGYSGDTLGTWQEDCQGHHRPISIYGEHANPNQGA